MSDTAGNAGRDLLEEVEELIASLASHPDAAVRAQVTALLQAVDAVHRTGLEHLLAGIRGMAGDAFIHRLTSDPAIRLLLMSYDLLAVDRRLLAEEALDTVRGHLHAHGIDLEIKEVVGGVVYVRIHGLEAGGGTLEAVRHDAEEALRAGLIGFQELVMHDREEAPAKLVPLGGLRRPNRPVYRRALASRDLEVGQMKTVELEGLPLLLANVHGEFYAVRNRCGDSPFPLQFGTLEGAELRCSFHGCRYDLRTGKRLDHEGERLPVFPVRVEGGEIEVAVSTEPAEG